MQNIDRVTEHIRRERPKNQSLHFHHTVDRKNYLMDDDGFWRLSNYVPSVTYDSCDDLDVGAQRGRGLRRFPADAVRLRRGAAVLYTIPDFTTRAALREAQRGRAGGPQAAFPRCVRSWTGLSVEDEACKLGPTCTTRASFRCQVTHNDTKINNVLFDEQTRRAVRSGDGRGAGGDRSGHGDAGSGGARPTSWRRTATRRRRRA